MVNVNFVGRLGADAEVRLMADGSQFLSFNVAVREVKGKEKTTSWMRVTYNNVGLGQYLKKGVCVHITGTESIRLYTTQSNEVQFSRDVKALSIAFVPTSNGENNTQATTVAVAAPQTVAVTSESVTTTQRLFNGQTSEIPTTPFPSTQMAMAAPSSDVGMDDDLPF